MIRAVLVVWLVCAALPSRAGECREFVGLVTGELAPCDGVLSPSAEAGRLITLEDERDKVAAELAAERARHELTREELSTLLRVERDARGACERERAPPLIARRAWWDSPWAGAALGTVVGVGATIALVYAVR